MSKIFQVLSNQNIDKRIAKFSTQKDLKLSQNSSKKDLRNLKLDPLSQMKSLNIESKPIPASSTNTNLIKKVKTVKTRKSIDISKKLKNSVQIKSFQNMTIFNESTEKIPVFDSETLTMTTKISEPLNEVSKIFILEKFRTLAQRLKSARKSSVLNNPHWFKYKNWKSILKKGINSIGLKWKAKRSAEILIKSWLRSSVILNKHKIRVISATKIQKYWTQVYKTRQYFLSAQKISRLLNPYAKKIYKIKSDSATTIQKYFRRFRVQKKYKPVLEQKASMRKHKMMLEKQASLVKNRNLKKSAVKTIEHWWLGIKEKQKMHEMRKYLLTLPYECRQLYIKFKKVKQDADNLKNDVDAMVAKKLERLQGK